MRATRSRRPSGDGVITVDLSLLIAYDMGCELITSGLDASRFAPVVRFGQSFHLGIHAHIQHHYGMAMYLITEDRSGRRCSELGRRFGLFALRLRPRKLPMLLS